MGISVTVLPSLSNGRHNEIHVMNGDGRNQRVVLSSPRRHPVEPVWAPDGRGLIYQTHYGQFVVDLDGGQPRPFLPRIPFDLDGLTWSSDGRTIAFIDWTSVCLCSREAHEIYRIAADGSGLRRLTRTRVGEYGVDWSPAG